MHDFCFIDREGSDVTGSALVRGYEFRDFFDCDILTATSEELAKAYNGPDLDGVGVGWEPKLVPGA